jgi:hypothetical protein
MFQNDAYRSPLRKYRQLPGPVPTLADIAKHHAWFWVNCGCGHHAAIPVDRAIERCGVGATVFTIGPRMRCSVCDHLGAGFTLPSWGMADGYRQIPHEKIALGFANACADVC